MSEEKRKIAYGRIIYAAIGACVSVALSYFFSQRLTNEVDVLSYVATVFSILAGVVIAIISILGDPSMILDSSWRKDFFSAKETQRKLHRHTDLFLLYVILLAAIFAFALIERSDDIYRYAQFLCFFLICFAFWMSLSLPGSLKEIQRKRMDDAINAKKRG